MCEAAVCVWCGKVCVVPLMVMCVCNSASGRVVKLDVRFVVARRMVGLARRELSQRPQRNEASRVAATAASEHVTRAGEG